LIVKSLFEEGLVSRESAEIILTSLSDRSLIVNQPYKNRLRASILKNIIMKVGNDNV